MWCGVEYDGGGEGWTNQSTVGFTVQSTIFVTAHPHRPPLPPLPPSQSFPIAPPFVCNAVLSSVHCPLSVRLSARFRPLVRPFVRRSSVRPLVRVFALHRPSVLPSSVYSSVARPVVRRPPVPSSFVRPFPSVPVCLPRLSILPSSR